jgi:hypothetical protein
MIFGNVGAVTNIREGGNEGEIATGYRVSGTRKRKANLKRIVSHLPASLEAF